MPGPTAMPAGCFPWPGWGMAIYQWRLWQRDQALLARSRTPSAAPSAGRLACPSRGDRPGGCLERSRAHSSAHPQLPRPALPAQAAGAGGGRLRWHVCPSQRAGRSTDVLVLEQLSGRRQAARPAARLSPSRTERSFTSPMPTASWTMTASSGWYFPSPPELELAVTGTSIPSPAQLQNPFVLQPGSRPIVHCVSRPQYAPGLLGRNCALCTLSAAPVRGLEGRSAHWHGLCAGKKTRPGRRTLSARYPEAGSNQLPAGRPLYIRQQTRWLWNVSIGGRSWVRSGEAFPGKPHRSVIGLGMLALPFLALLAGPFLLVVWGLLITSGWLARLRYGGLFAR